MNESTDMSGSKTTIKDYGGGEEGQMRQLITTERFLYDEDLRRNPYLFESDEYIKQKWVERREGEYSNVKITNQQDEFINQNSRSNNSQKKNSKKHVDDDVASSRYESDAKHIITKKRKSNTQLKEGRKTAMSFKTENPRDA